jgi:hypothetical protein
MEARKLRRKWKSTHRVPSHFERVDKNHPALPRICRNNFRQVPASIATPHAHSNIKKSSAIPSSAPQRCERIFSHVVTPISRTDCLRSRQLSTAKPSCLHLPPFKPIFLPQIPTTNPHSTMIPFALPCNWDITTKFHTQFLCKVNTHITRVSTRACVLW